MRQTLQKINDFRKQYPTSFAASIVVGTMVTAAAVLLPVAGVGVLGTLGGVIGAAAFGSFATGFEVVHEIAENKKRIKSGLKDIMPLCMASQKSYQFTKEQNHIATLSHKKSGQKLPMKFVFNFQSQKMMVVKQGPELKKVKTLPFSAGNCVAYPVIEQAADFLMPTATGADKAALRKFKKQAKPVFVPAF